jgi:hypothetical protein
MSKEKFLSLSDAELVILASRHDIIVLENNFDREELIEHLIDELDPLAEQNTILHASNKRYESTCDLHPQNHDQLDFVFLQHYNQTKLIFIPTDPYWAFVDWEIGRKECQHFWYQPHFQEFFLRLVCYHQFADGTMVLADTANLSISEEIGHCYVEIIGRGNPNIAIWHGVELWANVNQYNHLVAMSERVLTQSLALIK